MTKRTAVCGVLYAVIAGGLLIFQPAAPRSVQGQAATLSLIDAYGAQATLNALATQSAYSQQQSAAQAAQSAAAAQAQAAALQAQAYAQAQQATASAQQQQAQIAAAQATADAAALQATAIVQQTRTAIEIAAQQTRSALEVRATATAAGLAGLKRRRRRLRRLTTANEAQRRDDEAIATSVAISVQATKTALDLQVRAEADQAVTTQRTNAIGSLVITDRDDHQRCAERAVAWQVLSRPVALPRAQSHARAAVDHRRCQPRHRRRPTRWWMRPPATLDHASRSSSTTLIRRRWLMLLRSIVWPLTRWWFINRRPSRSTVTPISTGWARWCCAGSIGLA